MVEEYQADGVIDVILQAAIPMAWNRWRLNAICANGTIFLYMAIETDLFDSGPGQLSTRVAAFIEML